jgi:hypothetical protein
MEMEKETRLRAAGVSAMKILAGCGQCSLLFGSAPTQDAANLGFRSLRVDAGKGIGEIRSFQPLHPLR